MSDILTERSATKKKKTKHPKHPTNLPAIELNDLEHVNHDGELLTERAKDDQYSSCFGMCGEVRLARATISRTL